MNGVEDPVLAGIDNTYFNMIHVVFKVYVGLLKMLVTHSPNSLIS